MEVFEALRAGDNARLRRALESGVNLRMFHDADAIEDAATRGNLEAVQLLRSHGSPLTLLTLSRAWSTLNVPLWEFLFRQIGDHPDRRKVIAMLQSASVMEVAFTMGFLRPSDVQFLHVGMWTLFARLLGRISRCQAAVVCILRLPVYRDVRLMLARAVWATRRFAQWEK
jgi:hypothetical protein